MSHVPQRRALLSCSDKSGLANLAADLSHEGFDLYASEGTHAFLSDAGVASHSISEAFQLSPMLDGRVKTLDRRIFAGLLATEDHEAEMAAQGYFSFDILVTNLYPFAEARTRHAGNINRVNDFIDIGGSALLRAAAKNWRRVLVVSDPRQYEDVRKALRVNAINDTLRRKHAAAAIRKTADIDANIAEWLENDVMVTPDEHTQTADQPKVRRPPMQKTLTLRKLVPLRYGENPQQTAALYTTSDQKCWNDWLSSLQANNPGKEKPIGYNNLVDAQVAWGIVSGTKQPTCAIVKHATPCGVASASDALAAWHQAANADPVSRYGGVVAINRPVDDDIALQLGKRFLEALVAPSFDSKAVDRLKDRSVRCITPPPGHGKFQGKVHGEWNSFGSAMLYQDAMKTPSQPEDWTCATPDLEDSNMLADAMFAWRVVQWARSNAIVLAANLSTRGIGSGFTNRLDASHYAASQVALHHPTLAHPLVAASDAFFPFSDGLDPLAKCHVRMLVQPAGAKQQDSVIARAIELGIAVWLTSDRQFRH